MASTLPPPPGTTAITKTWILEALGSIGRVVDKGDDVRLAGPSGGWPHRPAVAGGRRTGGGALAGGARFLGGLHLELRREALALQGAELAARFPLALLTAKGAHHFLNSSYGGVERHVKAEKTPVVDVHPDDAIPRGVADGDTVRVFNDRGELVLPARVGDRVPPGVVSVPSGWWASRSPNGQAANALTPDGLSDLGGGGDFHSALVQVERT